MSTSTSVVTNERPPVSSRSRGANNRWRCTICGFIYDEALGLPEEGIQAGTAWADVPDDWTCPDCGVAKRDFSMALMGIQG